MRNPETIQDLPAANPTPRSSAPISEKELNILRHAIGYDDAGNDRWPNARSLDERRNRFITDANGPDGQICQALWARGLMKDYGPQSLAGGMHFYAVTDSGRAVVLANRPVPKKLTRSQARWREYRSCADCFESFWHFLKYKTRQARGNF